MSLAPYVRILGRGPGRSRSLTRGEARAAMEIMLSGEVDPQAVGALLMLLRMKGETADEIAGLAEAARLSLGQMPQVDLDWPSYAAGRTRGLPWFLLSARLVARAGHRVLLHGWNGPDAAVRAGLAEAGIAQVASVDEAARVLEEDGIAYLTLETLSPAVFALLSLRDVLGLRSCINTVARMLNPADAPASVQGVFHPSYRLLQADAAQILGWRALSVIKGGGGEFERHPGKAVTAFGLRNGVSWQAAVPALNTGARRLAEGPSEEATLASVWAGTTPDPFAEAIICGTAEIALDTLGLRDAPAHVASLWAGRHAPLAA